MDVDRSGTSGLENRVRDSPGETGDDEEIGLELLYLRGQLLAACVGDFVERDLPLAGDLIYRRRRRDRQKRQPPESRRWHQPHRLPRLTWQAACGNQTGGDVDVALNEPLQWDRAEIAAAAHEDDARGRRSLSTAYHWAGGSWQEVGRALRLGRDGEYPAER